MRGINLMSVESKGKKGSKIEHVSESDMAANAYVRKVKNIFTLPKIYEKLRCALQDPATTAQDLSDIIQFDIAMSAKVLSLINSAYYGFPREITSIQHAVSILGREKISQLVLAASMADVFEGIPSHLINMNSFWESCVSTALIARTLAVNSQHDQPDNVFMAALLHDIGRLVILSQSPDKAKQIMEMTVNDDSLSLLSAEYEVLGFTHTQVGGALLSQWQLPEVYEQVTRFHHYPIYNTDYHQEIALVHLSVYLNEHMQMCGNGLSGEFSAEKLMGKEVINQSGVDNDSILAAMTFSKEQYSGVTQSMF